MATTREALLDKDDNQGINEAGKETIKPVVECQLQESRLMRRMRYFSLFLSFMLIHTMTLQNTVYTSSLWPFLSQIDEKATETFFGYIRMAFYVTSAITSPFYGMWSNRITQVKSPLIFGIFLVILGNGLLMFVESFQYNHRWVILASRCISGAGYGSNGLLYAYIAMASTLSERVTAMTVRSIFTGLALFSGPAIQALFSNIGYPGFKSGPLHVNMYTAASLFNITIGLIQIMALLSIFQEHWVSTKVTSKTEEESPPVNYDRLAATVSIVMHGIIMFTIGSELSISPPYVMLMFGWNRKEVLRYLGILLAACGVLDPIATVFVGIFVLRYVKERSTMIPGIILAFVFHIMVLPWPGLPPIQPASVGTLNESLAFNVCSSHSWCDSMTKIQVWQYALGYVFLTLSLAGAFSPNIILFSKILGPTKQGISQGIFAASGYIGLGLGPIISTNLYYYFGPRFSYGLGTATMLLLLVLVIIMFKRLVPYHLKQKLKTNSNY